MGLILNKFSNISKDFRFNTLEDLEITRDELVNDWNIVHSQHPDWSDLQKMWTALRITLIEFEFRHSHIYHIYQYAGHEWGKSTTLLIQLEKTNIISRKSLEKEKWGLG